MTDNNIRLVNEDGTIVAKDPETGNTIPIELGETITDSLSTDDADIKRYAGQRDASQFDSIQAAIDDIPHSQFNHGLALGSVVVPGNEDSDYGFWSESVTLGPGHTLKGRSHGTVINNSSDHTVFVEEERNTIENLTIRNGSGGSHDALHFENVEATVQDNKVKNVAVHGDCRNGIHLAANRNQIEDVYIRGGNTHLLYNDCRYCVSRGINIRNHDNPQTDTTNLVKFDNSSNYNIFEGIVSGANSASDSIGVHIADGRRNRVKVQGTNCETGVQIDDNRNICDIMWRGSDEKALDITGNHNVIRAAVHDTGDNSDTIEISGYNNVVVASFSSGPLRLSGSGYNSVFVSGAFGDSDIIIDSDDNYVAGNLRDTTVTDNGANNTVNVVEG